MSTQVADDGVETVEDTGTTLVKVTDGFFDTPGALEKEGQPVRTKTPWIGLFGQATKGGRENLLAAGVEVNQFYLHDVAGPLKVKPFKYHLLKANRYYTKLNKDGRVIGADIVDPEKPKGKQSTYKEALVALVLVVTRSTMGQVELIPATWAVRSGVCKALGKAIELTGKDGLANDPAKWGARSAQHAIAAQARFAGGRFNATAWATAEPTADGENEYNLGHSQIGLPSPEEVAAFNKIMSGTDMVDKIIPATQSWAFRCEQIEKLFK